VSDALLFINDLMLVTRCLKWRAKAGREIESFDDGNEMNVFVGRR
jgi:hypothetical protein